MSGARLTGRILLTGASAPVASAIAAALCGRIERGRAVEHDQPHRVGRAAPGGHRPAGAARPRRRRRLAQGRTCVGPSLASRRTPHSTSQGGGSPRTRAPRRPSAPRSPRRALPPWRTPGSDFQRHNNRKSARCHRMSVSGRTTTNEVRQSKSLDNRARLTRLARFRAARSHPALRVHGECPRRNRFSTATIRVGRTATMANRSTSASS